MEHIHNFFSFVNVANYQIIDYSLIAGID